MVRKKSNFKPLYQSGYRLRDLKLINRSVVKTEIVAINYEITKCLKCGNRVVEFVNFVPISETVGAIVPGKCCLNCNSFYEENSNKISSLVNKNEYAKDYKIDYTYIIPDYFNNKKLFHSIKSGVVMVDLKNKTQDEYKTIMIVEKLSGNEKNDMVLHYKEPLSRKILTTIMHDEREVVTDGYEYEVLKVTYPQGINSIEGLNFKTKSVILYSGGGFYSNNEEIESVDALLYSPYTKMLECASVSYNQKTKEYYMDIKIFRRFVNNYGNPGVLISYYNNVTSSVNDLDYANVESFLHMYGYNVSQESAYSNEYRHKLLSEVIDLGLMKPENIVRLLEFNINMHQNNRFFWARQKWKLDIDFVCDYKKNPERFIIFNGNR